MNSNKRRLTPAPCIICGDPFGDDDEVIFCSDCGEPYHNSAIKPHNCWSKIGKKCKILGCHGGEYTLWPKIENYFLRLLGVRRTKLKSQCPHCDFMMSPLHKYCMACGHEINKPEAQKTFFAYRFAKWVQFRHRILLFILSMFVLLFLYWGGVTTITVVQKRIHEKQTAVAYPLTATMEIVQRDASATSRVAQNKTATAIKILSYTPTPSNTPTCTPSPTITPTSTKTLIPTLTWTPRTFWCACQTALKSRLHVGDMAFVRGNTEEALAVRDGPYRSYQMQKRLVSGDEVTIIDGPSCQKGRIIWWKVRVTKNGFVGWMEEANEHDYFLFPP